MVDTSAYAATFDIVDSNDDGHISAAELKQLMQALGEQISDEAAEQAVRQMDADGDGEITLAEFAAHMSRT